LGANALDPSAVSKIFAAKGRPGDNPLIVHIHKLSQLEIVSRDIPALAYRLAEIFWPGPLTLILKKTEAVPLETTAGLQTVAVRMPKHKIAALLLQEAEVPIAAPSANRSGKPSPTISQHVAADLFGKVDMILDGGFSRLGIESTVVDLTVAPPCILRPGSVTLEMLRETEPDFQLAAALADNDCPKSPGQKYTHYSPAAKLIIVSGKTENVIKKINQLTAENSGKKKIGILTGSQNAESYDKNAAIVISAGNRNKPETVAQNLFKVLRTFDEHGADIIYSESFPVDGQGRAVMDRLTKAAGGTVVEV
jgi:L-threonylcarbamoyladenylate synthase